MIFSTVKRHHQALKSKLVAIVLLNVLDIGMTFFLLDTGYYKEGNPLMTRVAGSPLMSIGVKLILPSLLVSYLWLRLKKATERQWQIAELFITGIFIFYILINLFHILMLILLPFLMRMI